MANILYGFCFYYGYYKKDNLVNHVKCFKSLRESYPEHNFRFIINVMVDSDNSAEREACVKKTREDIDLEDPIFTHNYNYGGTIAGLFNAYEYMKQTKYMKHNNLCDFHIAYFEEDFHPVDNKFLEASLSLLKDDIIYVGESTTGDLQCESCRGNAGIKVSRLYDSEVEIWSHGGYYFSNYERLDRIYEKVGCFHKGNPTTKYNHGRDGIDYGEVGFPTLLICNGFTLTCLSRYSYFVHRE